MSHLRQKDKSAPSFSFTWRIVVNSHVLPRTIMFGLELLGSASKSNNRQCFCNVHVLLTLTLLFLELFSFGLELPRSARAAMFTFCTHTHYSVLSVWRNRVRQSGNPCAAHHFDVQARGSPGGAIVSSEFYPALPW